MVLSISYQANLLVTQAAIACVVMIAIAVVTDIAVDSSRTRFTAILSTTTIAILFMVLDCITTMCNVTQIAHQFGAEVYAGILATDAGCSCMYVCANEDLAILAVVNGVVV